MSRGSIRCGLIGVGHHGSRYLAALADESLGGRLVAICRRDFSRREEIRQPATGRWFSDYRELIADRDVDAVIAVVPPDLHAELTSFALRAGKPILLEKPLAPTFEEASTIAQQARETGTRLMVAQTLRFDPVVQALRGRIGEAGKLSVISVSQHFKRSAARWVDRQGSLGTVVVTGVHGFDLVHWLAAEPIVEVLCAASLRLTKHSPDTFAAVARLGKQGLVATVENTRASGGRSERVEVTGAECQLVADITQGTLTRLNERQRQELPVGDDTPALNACLTAFLSSLRSGSPFPVSVDDALAAVRAAQACSESNRLGAAVRLD
jgi:predicted dehydrogenase